MEGTSILNKASSQPGTNGTNVRNVCVYCGSGEGRNPAYMQAARALGGNLAKAGIGLVYGGGGLGLMGGVAHAALEAGGHVTGIMPEFLSEREHQISGIQDLVIVKNMHERKMMMFERSDAFIALPGGIGTLEELVEQLTWSQLGQHSKPVVVVNINDFWSPFLALLAHMREETFIRDGLEIRFAVADDIEAVLPIIQSLSGEPDADAAASVLTQF